MPSSQIRSSLAETSLNGSNSPLGRKPGTNRCSSPKLKGQPTRPAWITVRRPRVATSRVSGDALRKRPHHEDLRQRADDRGGQDAER